MKYSIALAAIGMVLSTVCVQALLKSVPPSVYYASMSAERNFWKDPSAVLTINGATATDSCQQGDDQCIDRLLASCLGNGGDLLQGADGTARCYAGSSGIEPK